MSPTMILVLIGVGTILLIFLAIKFPLSKVKGSFGEGWVAKRLKILPEGEYTVLNDLLLQTSRGTSQIDHVVISASGIFVIETKNYRGWILGSENSEYWTQSVYGHNNRFRNPVKQNWAHVYALKEVLRDFGGVAFYPIVVFAGWAELKKVDSKVPVVYIEQLFDAIFATPVSVCLNAEQRDRIAIRLLEKNIKDKEVRKAHLLGVRNLVNEKKRMIREHVCPRCGGKLVEREGPYGKFFGCERFPECRFRVGAKGH